MTPDEHRAAAEGHLTVADNWQQYGDNPQRVRDELDAAAVHLQLADAAEHQTH